VQGEQIGAMGHSGKAGGPHVHVHIQKVRADLLQDLGKLVAAMKAGSDVGPFRPMQFHGVLAMQQDNVQPGWMNNPMSALEGEGAYFDKYVVWPWTGKYPS
jgi:murein DD-endopeptidase MepM/ murein hydrolase activator NlpD